MIGEPPDTIQDRSIVIRMRRKLPSESVKRLRPDRVARELSPLASKLARWAKDNAEALRAADPDVPASLHDRAQDNWRPLLAIADRCGGPWPDAARRAAEVLESREEGQDSTGTQVLIDIHDIFASSSREKLSSQDLVEELADFENRLWGEWRNGRPITPIQLARLLKTFGIHPGTIRLSQGTAKGYLLADFKETWDRYTPQPDPSHPEQVNEDKDLGAGSSRNTDGSVTDRDDGISPCEQRDVTGVPGPKGHGPTTYDGVEEDHGTAGRESEPLGPASDTNLHAHLDAIERNLAEVLPAEVPAVVERLETIRVALLARGTGP